MIEVQPKPDWAQLPRPGCANVEFRVLLKKDGLSIAALRFAENATIDEHDAPFEIDVICVAGNGLMKLAGETFEFSAGQTVRWPTGVMHKLWTFSSTMETLMVERING